ncbi:MAG: putative Fe-Mo cluster-binding protein, NifX family [Candidatus Methanohalarchaeum thermophilum]|uniref:Fe-Mo cluster-binding protein, NifX family n=1 Tax=Methanohalarchaeum thermophilum TaxID=1903181 RepID=A0A1Q6DSK1_METT1|nr:MAG: putative Fe-Mo cluster-binding protein, NifX family [Candidatus Methanohalarchaeum thermophilum]
MEVAIPSTGRELNSQVSDRFGRCTYILIADTNGEIKEVIENEFQDAASGAGVQTSQKIANKKVKAVVTKNIGPNAFSILENSNIKIYEALDTVKESLNKLESEELNEINQGKPRGKPRGQSNKQSGKGQQRNTGTGNKGKDI